MVQVVYIPPKRKYRNQPIEIDGEKFHSKLEAKHYHQLKLREKAGEIKDLARQPVYLLEANGCKIGKYTADFKFFDIAQDKFVVVDSKGFDTDASKLRRKIVEALYGIEVEVWKK